MLDGHAPLIAFLHEYKQTIIERWSIGLDKAYPGVYNVSELMKQGEIYFEIFIEICIPLEQHPVLELLPQWCQRLVEKNVPLEHTLHSSHIWRAVVMETIEQFYGDSNVSVNLLQKLNSRIDSFERKVCMSFAELSNSLINEKEQKINELHDDRITIIGKMAASMAHELRNPLTSIGGFLKLLRSNLSEESSRKVSKYIDVIQTEFESFQMQITGFLSFSKKRVYEEPLINITVNQLVDSVLSLVHPRLVSENIHLEIGLVDGIYLHVQKVAMQQVLSNLINNGIDALSAVDHDKMIKISSREDQDAYYISVSNNGPEIPEPIKPTLFSPFVTGKADGTGLGLAICKQIMERNNGDITFTSTGEETEFTILIRKSKQQV
jgi:two-component system, sporulation sensor kinase D